jgi:hypothetical protein
MAELDLSATPLNRVRSFPETAEICGISLATLRRRIRAGKGPRVTALSEKRRGVSDRDREAWLEECTESAPIAAAPVESAPLPQRADVSQ